MVLVTDHINQDQFENYGNTAQNHLDFFPIKLSEDEILNFTIMKNIFLTIVIVLYSVSITAQKSFRNYNSIEEKELDSLPDNPFNKFCIKVISNEDFKYRTFLRETRRSDVNYQIGEQQLSKKELTKLLRKCARKSGNSEEFKQYLIEINPEFSTYFSDGHTPKLYEKFRKGTLNQYIIDLIDDWSN